MSRIYQQAQILILEILNVFLWLLRLRWIAFPRSKSGIFNLALNKIEHFSKVSTLPVEERRQDVDM